MSTTSTPRSRDVPEIDFATAPGLRPADRAVAFLALAEVCKAQADAAKKEALQLADATGASSFRTPMGALTITQKDAPLQVNDAALLEWVREHEPSMIETVEQVKPWFAKQTIESLVAIDGKIYHPDDLPQGTEWTVIDGDLTRIDGETVEPVPYATLGAKPAPYASWTSSAAKKAGLQAVHELLELERDNLAARALGAGK